jgi:predicted phage gp36 major capsid-like protein
VPSSDVIKTADGKPLSFPTSDGTAETGEWIAQNTTATGADAVVRHGVPQRVQGVVQDRRGAVRAPAGHRDRHGGFVRNRASRSASGALGNTGFTVGTGTTQPDGVVPRASAGKVGTTGQTLTIIYDDIVDLVHAVDPAYRATGCSFMTNDALLKVLRKIKDTAGRPIWIPSYDQGIRFGANNESKTALGEGGYTDQTTPVVFDYLLGYPVWVNNDIAVPAANAKSMLFGNFKYYKVRDAMEVQMFRFTDSAYAKLGQVGFLAWARMGGNLVDTNAVKYYQHSAT